MEAARNSMRMRRVAAHETIDAEMGEIHNARGMAPRHTTDDALGLYISIPFCRSKCTYCNFASGVYPASQHERYVDRVIDDLRNAARWAAQAGVHLPRRVDTVYLGGGTPNLLAPELVARLFAAVRAEFSVDSDAEITVECAPGQFVPGTLDALASAGVNRVSLGVQSFVDAEARATGRLHTRAVVEDDLRRLRATGITNLNLDLIAGLAGQTLISWEESLSALIDSRGLHASVYMLEVDEDSRLGRELLGGGARYYAQAVPSDDAIARMYERALERLHAAGFSQYEISNFSGTGFESRHNLRYWQRRPYLGVGLDASSMLRATAPPQPESDSSQISTKYQGTTSAVPQILPYDETALSPATPDVLRATTTDDLDAYLAGSSPSETAWLSVDRQHEEAWFLGLRLNSGVSLAALEAEFGSARVEPARLTAQQLASKGLLELDGSIARLTPRGQMLSNDVFAEFLGLTHESAFAEP
jgi:oxygen-independent coproporphyrinogen-3 oxidase